MQSQTFRELQVEVQVSMADVPVPSIGVAFGNLRQGDLARRPFEDGAFDLAAWALARSHEPNPAPVIAELARVRRRPG